MSGHSKWATTKHKKMAQDAKRGKLFTKAIREITVAARVGGGDPQANPRLRTAIQKAREVNMPQENIKKAIQRGTGELPGVTYEEATYEGYGPGGVAMLIEILSDNRNRTVSEIRNILTKNGGSMAEAGAVSWMFEKKGYIAIRRTAADEDQLMGLILEAGAEDLSTTDPERFEVITRPGDFEKVRQALQEAKIEIESAEVSMIPKTYVPLDGKEAEHLLRLMDLLEDQDDVQKVYANFDIPNEVIERVAG